MKMTIETQPSGIALIHLDGDLQGHGNDALRTSG